MPTRIEDVPEHLVVDFDITDPALAEPHRRLAEIQAMTPIVYAPHHGGYWMVTGYAEAQHVSRDYRCFSNERYAVPEVSGDRQVPIGYDPPEHTAYRQLLTPLFSPARMKQLAPQIRRTTTELIDAFVGRGECEFISEFAHPLPTRTFLSLMGWPLADADQLARWAADMLAGRPGASVEVDLAARAAATQQVMLYFSEMLAERRKHPGDDATSALLQARYASERTLTETELLSALSLLLVGGLHTVRGVLGFGLIQLTRFPKQRQKLLCDSSLIPSAVEELLRLEAPLTSARIVARPTTYGGVTMQPGDMVLVFLSAANRDPQHFVDPHSMEITRSPNRHLSFGSGPHYCVGATLGRIELAIAFEEFHRRIPDYSLADNQPPVLHHSQVRGLYEMPIRFTPYKMSL